MDAPRRVMPCDQLADNLRERIQVLIDGDMLRGVVGYDIDEGWVMVVKFSEAGEPLVVNGGNYIVRQKFGQIRATIHE